MQEILFVFAMTYKLLLCWIGLLLSFGLCRAEPDKDPQTPFWAGKPWAEYSPYAPAASYKSPSHGCTIKQVNIVSSNSCRCNRFPHHLFLAGASRSSIPDC